MKFKFCLFLQNEGSSLKLTTERSIEFSTEDYVNFYSVILQLFVFMAFFLY